MPGDIPEIILISLKHIIDTCKKRCDLVTMKDLSFCDFFKYSSSEGTGNCILLNIEEFLEEKGVM